MVRRERFSNVVCWSNSGSLSSLSMSCELELNKPAMVELDSVGIGVGVMCVGMILVLIKERVAPELKRQRSVECGDEGTFCILRTITIEYGIKSIVILGSLPNVMVSSSFCQSS